MIPLAPTSAPIIDKQKTPKPSAQIEITEVLSAGKPNGDNDNVWVKASGLDSVYFEFRIRGQSTSVYMTAESARLMGQMFTQAADKARSGRRDY